MSLKNKKCNCVRDISNTLRRVIISYGTELKPRYGFFHKFIGERHPKAIIEFEDGSLEAISINYIKFNNPS